MEGFKGARPKKDRRVTAIFRHCQPSQHCSGINSLLIPPDGQALYSASRDATIKKWDITRPQATFVQNFEGHVDWVNDIVTISRLLISCSSDRTVKVWHENGTCAHTDMSHNDCATALAAAPLLNQVFSAGEPRTPTCCTRCTLARLATVHAMLVHTTRTHFNTHATFVSPIAFTCFLLYVKHRRQFAMLGLFVLS